MQDKNWKIIVLERCGNSQGIYKEQYTDIIVNDKPQT